MGSLLSFEEYGDGIGDGWRVIRDHANRVGPRADVPTCPGWLVRDLVAHQGAVHRWATAVVRGGPRSDIDDFVRAGLEARDQLGWLDVGARDLLQALVDAPDDLEAFFFLHDAPPPKLAWARRQCHEITIHGVDAMSASLRRPPRATETWIGPRLAADGVDELLCGFVPRTHGRLRSTEPRTVLVETTDTDDAWTMTISAEPVVTRRGSAGTPGSDVTGSTGAITSVITGTATELYLGLWNRGDELTCTGADFLAQWRAQATIS